MAIIKVDEVRSAGDAVWLRDLGVDIISVRSAVLAGWDMFEWLLDRLCVRFDLSDQSLEYCVDFLREAPPLRYVEFAGHALPDKRVADELSAAGRQLIFSQISADHDDDPSWVLSRHLEMECAGDPIYQVNFACDLTDGWEWMVENESDEAGLSISDIADLAKRNRILLTTSFTEGNLSKIVSRLRGVEGVALPLSTGRDVKPAFSQPAIERLIRSLRE